MKFPLEIWKSNDYPVYDLKMGKPCSSGTMEISIRKERETTVGCFRFALLFTPRLALFAIPPEILTTLKYVVLC
jgi:hypothetical protein